MVAEAAVRAGGRVALDGRARERPSEGDLVLLGSGKRGPRVVRGSGGRDVARDVLEALMLDRGLRPQLPAGRGGGGRAVADAPAPAVGRAGRDLTDLPTFTIDPAGARDFDDAVSAQRAGRPGTSGCGSTSPTSAPTCAPAARSSGRRARRATSVYVPGRRRADAARGAVEQACSLCRARIALAVTVEMEMDGAEVAFRRPSTAR